MLIVFENQQGIYNANITAVQRIRFYKQPRVLDSLLDLCLSCLSVSLPYKILFLAQWIKVHFNVFDIGGFGLKIVGI